MSRIIWRRAHVVRLPDRISTPVHQEMLEAYERDKRIDAAIALYLEPEIDRLLADREVR